MLVADLVVLLCLLLPPVINMSIQGNLRIENGKITASVKAKIKRKMDKRWMITLENKWYEGRGTRARLLARSTATSPNLGP